MKTKGWEPRIYPQFRHISHIKSLQQKGVIEQHLSTTSVATKVEDALAENDLVLIFGTPFQGQV